jgi:hypothetical protein
MNSEVLNQAYAKFYKPQKHVALNKVNVELKDSHFRAVCSQEKEMFQHQNLQTM